MIKIRDGFSEIKHKNNNGRYVHIVVESEKQDGTVYYILVDTKKMEIKSCSCPQASLYPFEKCKHQKAVFDQRILGQIK